MNNTLTTLLHLYASHLVHYEILDGKLLNIYVCAIRHVKEKTTTITHNNNNNDGDDGNDNNNV